MTSPEALAERYAGRWTIYRALPAGSTSGGGWVADPCTPGGKRLTAPSVDALAKRLERAAGKS